MADFRFHEKIQRSESFSVKWDQTREVFGAEELLPMWVADMDFRPPEEVKQAFQERINHGIYGYTYVPPTASEAIRQWLKTRHGWSVNEASILYSPGVVPSIAIAIEAYTEPGDKVLLQSPVYTPFFNMIKKNDRIVVNSQLELRDGRFEINFEDFEKQLKEGVKLFLLCNPHNPGGRVWTETELTKIGELCAKYNCIVLSDEIHSDLVFKRQRHIPIASLNSTFANLTVTCVAPTKTFNLAGIQASAVIAENEKLRLRFQEIQQKQGFFTLNTFGIIGMEAAYRHGKEWLDELLEYLHENIQYTKQFVKEHLPELSIMEPEGTYLLWIDCRKLGLTDKELRDLLIQKGKLGLEPGPKYGPGGEGFVRMNIACPRETLIEGLNRLKMALG